MPAKATYNLTVRITETERQQVDKLKQVGFNQHEIVRAGIKALEKTPSLLPSNRADSNH